MFQGSVVSGSQFLVNFYKIGPNVKDLISGSAYEYTNIRLRPRLLLGGLELAVRPQPAAVVWTKMLRVERDARPKAAHGNDANALFRNVRHMIFGRKFLNAEFATLRSKTRVMPPTLRSPNGHQ